MFQITVSLTLPRRRSSGAPNSSGRRVKPSARRVSNAKSASRRSRSTSSTLAPNATNRAIASSQTARTEASIGRPPTSGHHATRSLSSSPRSSPAKSVGSPCDKGDRGSGPTIAVSISARSPTVRAIGPTTDATSQTSPSPGCATSPGVGRSPTTLLNDAGLRMLPPWSEPSASGSMPAASAAPAPPLLPPADRSRRHGLRVVPNTSLNVCDPAPSSGVLVLPTTIAPAARRRATSKLSVCGTFSAKSFDPYVVRIPAVSIRSLMAIGSPCSGPSGSRRAIRRSAASASASAASGRRLTIALTFGLTASIRSRCAATTSRADSSRSRIARDSSRAVRQCSSTSRG